MLDQLQDLIELSKGLSLPIITLIGLVIGWKQTGHINLSKTLNAFKAIIAALLKELESGETEADEKEVKARAVELVKEHRKRKRLGLFDNGRLVHKVGDAAVKAAKAAGLLK